jgi:hypothetical protein
MVWHEVENDLQVSSMGIGNQGIEVGKCAEEGMNIAVIRHIVAKIGHGRRKDRREPDRINSQIDQIIESGANAAQIANPVAIAVLE